MRADGMDGAGVKLVTVPNLISALRLPIAAAFLAVDGVLWRALLLLLGGVTDAMDGWLARKLGVQSRAGALIDPLFDKLFVLIALGAFLPGPYLSWLGFAILISRDLYIGFGFIVAKLIGVEVSIRPRYSGKLVTFLQLVTLFVLLFAPDQTDLFVVVVGVASGIAVIDYTSAGIASLKKHRQGA